jgi:hypothetical protein
MMPGLEAGMAPGEVVIATLRRREMGCINLGTLNCIPCITLSVLKWSSYHGGTWLYLPDVSQWRMQLLRSLKVPVRDLQDSL